ncbi:hypothetical protein D9M72_427190 [compost metagenome]
MVLQVLAHARQGVAYVDAECAQPFRLADAGQLQQLRCIDRAGGEDDFMPHRRGMRLPAADVLHASAAPSVESERADLRAGDDGQVRALRRAAQEGLGGVPADAAALVHLKVADAEVVALVEVVGTRDAGLFRRIGKALENVPAQPLRFDAPLAVGTMEFARAAVVVLAALEQRKHVVPFPAVVAGQAGPVVVVFALAAHVDHAVD